MPKLYSVIILLALLGAVYLSFETVRIGKGKGCLVALVIVGVLWLLSQIR